MTKKITNEGIAGFEWPANASDKKRIFKTSEKYKDLTIPEAFEAEYGMRIHKDIKKTVGSMTYKDLAPGDIIEVQILDINKKGVIFEQGAYKENFISTINLFQYPNFKTFIPKEPIKAKVMSKTHAAVYIDIFQPMLDDFITEINERIEYQATINQPILTRVRNLKHMKSGYTGDIRIDTISDFCGKDVYIQGFIPGSQIALNIESDFAKWDGQSVDAFVTNLAVKPGTTDITIACSVKEYLRFLGNCNAIKLFGVYCADKAGWDEQSKKVYDGNITGVCRTQNKSGVFVEIPELNITGMIPTPADQLTQYKPGPCNVRITAFDELMRYNREVGQMQHVEPYVINEGLLRKCNLKCVFDWA